MRVFRKLIGFLIAKRLPIQKCIFPINAIRIALLYSGFISITSQTINMQKFSCIPFGCKKNAFLHNRPLWFPDYRQLFAADNFNRRHFLNAFFSCCFKVSNRSGCYTANLRSEKLFLSLYFPIGYRDLYVI